MGALIYHVFASSALLSLGLYHLISAVRSHLKTPREYVAKLFHPFPNAHQHHRFLRYLQIYLIILCLLVALIHQLLVSADADPLLKGRTPVHRFLCLQSAAVIVCFIVLAAVVLLSDATSLLPLPFDLFFAIASVFFFLQYSFSSSDAAVQTSDLQAKFDSVSGGIYAFSSAVCLVLCCQPKLFAADAALGASFCLQGMWELQTGLSLYVDAFIPEGCHKLLDVVSGVEGSTKCELEDSKLRAIAILDLMFVIHVLFVFMVFVVIYSAIARNSGVRSRFVSYETLPTASTADSNHIQLKTMSGTQA